MVQAEPELSVVIPVYNEEENLPGLLEELDRVLADLGKTHEIICVDDGSTDGSRDVLSRLAGRYSALRCLQHQGNYGESAAQATGFRAARGSIVVTMDADGQNDPADLPRLIEALKADTACVCGVRRVREDSFVKRISSKIANAFRNFVTGDRITDAGCTYRAIRKEALVEVVVFNGMHRFLPTILRAQGFKVVELPVNHRPRRFGCSKYGIGNRLWRGILDCLAVRWYRRRAVPAERTAK